MEYVEKYNEPVYWPVILVLVLGAISFIPAVLTLRRKYK